MNLFVSFFVFDNLLSALLLGEGLYTLIVVGKCTPKKRNEYWGLTYYHVGFLWYVTQRNPVLNLILFWAILLEFTPEARDEIYKSKEAQTISWPLLFSVVALYICFPLILFMLKDVFVVIWYVRVCVLFLVTIVLCGIIMVSTTKRLYVLSVYRYVLLFWSFTNLLK